MGGSENATTMVVAEFLRNFESRRRRKELFSDRGSYKKNITGRTRLVHNLCIQCTILNFNFQLKEFKFSSNVRNVSPASFSDVSIRLLCTVDVSALSGS